MRHAPNEDCPPRSTARHKPRSLFIQIMQAAPHLKTWVRPVFLIAIFISLFILPIDITLDSRVWFNASNVSQDQLKPKKPKRTSKPKGNQPCFANFLSPHLYSSACSDCYSCPPRPHGRAPTRRYFKRMTRSFVTTFGLATKTSTPMAAHCETTMPPARRRHSNSQEIPSSGSRARDPLRAKPKC